MPRTSEALYVFIGGSIGAGLRWLADAGVGSLVGWWSPLAGLLFVNTVGSFLLGRFTTSPMAARFHPFVAVGVLGSFTTFSGFALATAIEWNDRNPVGAVGFAALSVSIAFVAAVLGRRAGVTS